MTNLERLKMVVGQLQFMINENIIDENCGSICEEVYSTMEILVDADICLATAFHHDMMTFSKMIGGETK